MALNIGYIELVANNDVSARIYYDTAWLDDDPGRDPDAAPLINGPRGYCLDMTNLSGRVAKITVNGLAGRPLSVMIGKGDPVVTGPPTGRSLTAAEMRAAGFATRGDVGPVELG